MNDRIALNDLTEPNTLRIKFRSLEDIWYKFLNNDSFVIDDKRYWIKRIVSWRDLEVVSILGYPEERKLQIELHLTVFDMSATDNTDTEDKAPGSNGTYDIFGVVDQDAVFESYGEVPF